MKRKLILFAVLIVLTGCLPGKQSGEEKKGNPVMMVCHRGANRLAPENTYASAQKAIDAGAAYVEVDVRRSKDGVYYNFHDNFLERTTNGNGLFSETTSEVIDTLDAGAWFAHEFAGEKVPRIVEFLKWVKGKAKVYFDMKEVNLAGFVPEIAALGMEKECFFWFSDPRQAKKFREMYPDLALKVNASTAEALDSLQAIYHPQIIECSVDDLSDQFIRACHEKGMKVMPWVPGNDWEAYRLALAHDIDMINLDNPDVFANMAANNGEYRDYKLIAHRGGIVEGKFNEFDPASIQAAVDQGYFMLEVDVQDTRDGILILNHDRNFNRFYGDPRRVDEMTWEEIKNLRAEGKNYHPLSFEEFAATYTERVKLMIDVKEKDPTPAFYQKLGEVMEKYGFLKDAYFIDNPAKAYFWGKAKFGVRIHEMGALREKLEKGEDVACHYFLFDSGTKLNSSLIKLCQKASITVVPSVNFGHYHDEDPVRGAKRDIQFLKACGVTEFQIDSDFDDWLPVK